jgi:hypothetical protein
MGGGAIVITAGSVRTLDVWSWIDEQRRGPAMTTSGEATAAGG